jgi:hypothetical protein
MDKINFTDICLIPKVEHPEFVNQFWPISLWNTLYKIVTKVVVNILKELIPLIISPYQTGFIPRHSIHENIVVAQEMIHNMWKMNGKEGYFAIKVDLSKTYDMLNWNFIDCTLRKIGLLEDLTKVIMKAITSVKINVKCNGARADCFRTQKVIRQGDMLSPYLFVAQKKLASHLREWCIGKGV